MKQNGLLMRITGGVDQNPGPAEFNVRTKPGDDTPQWTIKNRYPDKIESNDADYVNLPSTLGDVPPITLHSRPQDKPLADTPGPSYIPPTIGSDAPKVSMTSRRDDTKYNDNPGTFHP